MTNSLHPKDPITHNEAAARELFRQFSVLANGFTTLDALNAALGIVVNALRQAHGRREEAARNCDEIMARAKGLLMDCYDSTGRKKGVYPYHQTLEVPFLDLSSRKK